VLYRYLAKPPLPISGYSLPRNQLITIKKHQKTRI